MKLRVPKLTWKQKVDKLRRIVLAGPAIENLPAGMLEMLEAWRGHTHGKITAEEYMRIGGMYATVQSNERLIWEPYSDERGDEEALFGWIVRATMFGIDGQPWWLVKARRSNVGHPTDQQVTSLHKAIELLGCHDTKRDMIREFPDEGGFYTMFWSWFHTGKLMEIHLHPKTVHMLHVDEGTPLKPGYERLERISRHNPAGAAKGQN